MHKDTSYPGLHDPIIEQEMFDAVQQKLERNRKGRRQRVVARAPLTSVLFDALGNRMATHARDRGGQRYLYYISPVPVSDPDAAQALRRVPAPTIEQILLERLRRWSKRSHASWDELRLFVKRVELHPQAVLVELAPPLHEIWSAEAPERCETPADGLLRITSPVSKCPRRAHITNRELCRRQPRLT